MNIRRCGYSGFLVSEYALGTLLWGRDTPADEAIEMLGRFVEAGGSVVEISTAYGDGAALNVLGNALAEVGRERVVIALREGLSPVHPSAATPAASRSALLRSVDQARIACGTDYIDLLLAGSDQITPLKETVDACVSLYDQGAVHYLGLSHRGLWGTAWACGYLRGSGQVPITACEEDVSLLTYTRSVPLLEVSRQEGFGVLAHSPLAGGVLTGKYRHSTPPDSRAASTHLYHFVDWALSAEYTGITEAVARAAEGLGRTPLDVALAWVRDLPGVSSTVIGPRTSRQLEQILTSSSEPLPDQIRQVLTEIASQ